MYCQNCKANRAMRDLNPGWICLSCKAIHFINTDTNKIDYRLPKIFTKRKERKEQVIINN